MATTEILAVGVAAASSTVVTLVDGQGATVSLKPKDAGSLLTADAVADVQFQTSDGGWVNLPAAQLSIQAPVMGLQGPGTFRVTRRAGASANFGVDKS